MKDEKAREHVLFIVVSNATLYCAKSVVVGKNIIE
jgi:hypothetical protein